MAVSARVETGLLARSLPIGTKTQHTGSARLVEPMDRRDALCPPPKIQTSN